jgi:hypothetical protein
MVPRVVDFLADVTSASMLVFPWLYLHSSSLVPDLLALRISSPPHVSQQVFRIIKKELDKTTKIGMSIFFFFIFFIILFLFPFPFF